MIKFDLNEFLKDKNVVIQTLVIIALIALYIAPGQLLIAYARPGLLIDLSEVKLLFLSAALSLPLHILAAVLLIAPAPTQREIMRDPSAIRQYVLSLGALVWAVLLLLLLPVLAKFIGSLFPMFSELDLHYQLLYTYMIFFAYCLAVFVRSLVQIAKAKQ